MMTNTMIRESSTEWSERLFSDAPLNDVRRTRRLVRLAATMADNIGKTIGGAAPDNAALQGAYRFINNPSVTAEAIAQTGFAKTALKAKDEKVLLALEDTCTLSLPHESLANELTSTNALEKSRAMLFHNVLLCSYDIEYNRVKIIDMLDIQWWSRVNKTSKKVKNIPYEDRESIKWEKASRNMANIMGSDMRKVISICDRESDIYQYLLYKNNNNQRVVIRSTHNRKLEGNIKRLHECGNLKNGGRREVLIKQRGGRKHRKAIVQVEYDQVELLPPKGEKGETLTLNYVRCTEIGSSENKLIWHLLTNERVENKKDAQLIALYYEKRWLIEEYHKAWKSGGTNVEKQRLQSKEGIEKLALILAFSAVRILRLRELGEEYDADDTSCKEVLSDTEWKVLWLKTESDELPHDFVPSIRWAYLALGKLGKRHPPKRNIRIGWQSLWKGYYVLEVLVEGYKLANRRNKKREFF